MVMKKGTKIITLRLLEEAKFQIEIHAPKEDRSVNNWILNIISNYLKEQNAKNREPRFLSSSLNFKLLAKTDFHST